MSTITVSPVLSRSSTPEAGSSTFTVRHSNKSAVVPRNLRTDVDIAIQKLSVEAEKKDKTQEWAAQRQGECTFVSTKDEAMVLKMLVVEANRFQTQQGSTKLQQALTNRSQDGVFEVDLVAAGVSPRVLGELLKDLDIVMGLCQSDTKCRSPYQSTKKSLGSLPLWQSESI